MRRWLRDGWTMLWGSRPFQVRSPLDVAAAVQVLDADRARFLTPAGTLPDGGRGAGRVVGRVRADDVRLRLSTGRRNSFSPVLRARFTALPDGCELAGAFTAPRLSRAVVVGWLVVVIVAAQPSNPGSAPAFLAYLALGAGLGVLGLTMMMVLVARFVIRDEEYLRDWVGRRLRGPA